MGLAEVAKLAVELGYKDGLSPGLAKTKTNVRSFDSAMGSIASGSGRVASGLAKAGTRIAAGLGTALVAAAKIGSDFEAQLNTINTVAQVSDDKLKGIGDGIRQLSRTTGTSTADLTSAYYDLVSAGISAADAQNVLNEANKLAIGGLSTTGEAVDLLTSAINSYGKDASRAAEFTNYFAEAIAAGKTTAADIAGSFSMVGPIAAKFGVGVDEIAAALGVMTAQGSSASEVFTDMRAAIKLLAKPTKDVAHLAKETGHNYAEIAKKSGIAAAYQQMDKDAKAAGTSILAISGRMEAAQFAAAVTGQSFDDYNKELEKVRHSSDGAGVAAQQMAQRQKGLSFAVGLLRANLKDAGLTLSEGFLPALTRSAQKLSGFLGEASNREALKKIGEDIGKAIDDIDWQQVLDGAKELVAVMKIALDYAKGLFAAVNALPTPVKAAGAGFLALDKLSGGLIGSGLGGIIGGVGSAIAKGAASKVPGLGRLVAQPVFVTNWPAGGLMGGGGGGVAGFAGRAAGGLGSALGGGAALGAAALAVSGAIVAGAAIATQKLIVQPKLDSAAARNIQGTQATIASGDTARLQSAIQGLQAMPEKLNPLQRVLYELNANGVKTHTEGLVTEMQKALATSSFKGKEADQNAAITSRMSEASDRKLDNIATKAGALQPRLDSVKSATDAVGTKTAMVQSGIALTTAAVNGSRDRVAGSIDSTRGAVYSSGSMVASAVRSSRPIVTVNVSGVTAATVRGQTTYHDRTGKTGGSHAGGHAPGTGPLP